MKKWFNTKRAQFLLWWHTWKSQLGKRNTVPVSPYSPIDFSVKASLDEYADDQIAALLVAVKEYKEARKNPHAFVEKYFSTKLMPRPHKDSWIRDLEADSVYPLGFSFVWNEKGREK